MDIETPKELHLFGYVQNDPINRIDSRGLMDQIDVHRYFHWGTSPPGYSREDMERWDSGRAIHMHCTVRCWGKVIIGETITQTSEKGLTKLAKDKAIEWAAKMVKFAGTISAIYSGYKAVRCFIDCECPVD